MEVDVDYLSTDTITIVDKQINNQPTDQLTTTNHNNESSSASDSPTSSRCSSVIDCEQSIVSDSPLPIIGKYHYQFNCLFF